MMKTLHTTLLLIINLSVCHAQVKEFWGMTSEGGIGAGAIFKTDSLGNNPQMMYSFGENPGANPEYTKCLRQRMESCMV